MIFGLWYLGTFLQFTLYIIYIYSVVISLFCAVLWIIAMASHLVKKHGVVQLNADATYSKYNHTTTKNMMSFT